MNDDVVRLQQELKETIARRDGLIGKVDDLQRELRLKDGVVETLENSSHQMEIELEVRSDDCYDSQCCC